LLKNNDLRFYPGKQHLQSVENILRLLGKNPPLMQQRILIVDDSTELCSLLSNYLKRENFETDEAYSAASALKLLEKNQYGLVICDYRLPDADGIDLIPKMKRLQPDTPIIIMTAYADVKISIRCIKLGALDYITKPIHHQEMLALVKDALTSGGTPAQQPAKAKATKSNYVWGNSPQSKRMLKNIELVAPTDMTVIVHGESGTGKEFVANAIHERSPRSGKQFVAIDCGSLTEELAGSELFGHIKGAFTGALQDKKGQFELANGGTLFLDEIGNLTYENQVKLLRVLQERKVRKVVATRTFRSMCASWWPPTKICKRPCAKGGSEKTCFHRLNEFSIQIDPLRERKQDIDIYVEHFLHMANESLSKQVKQVDDITYEKLRNYYWHGNIRELKNVMKRAVLLASSNEISVDCIPTEIVFGTHASLKPESGDNGAIVDLKSVVEEAEKKAIMQVLRETNFNKSDTAKRLKVDRKTLYNKMNQYGLV
jgi:two-component system response regulator HydG